MKSGQSFRRDGDESHLGGDANRNRKTVRVERGPLTSGGLFQLIWCLPGKRIKSGLDPNTLRHVCFLSQRSLTLDCQEGQPGIIQWTPDRNTPDLVYYQCYTHRYLGWKIHVVDSCDQ